MRISRRGTFADGEPMSRTAAVAYCRRAPRGAEIVIEDELAWNDVRSSLEREGVHFSVRRICDPCRRSFPAGPIQPKREIQPTRDTR